ncbi:MAG: right-handed parallel beta-helix repeat-containing protein [Chitinophagales bacterium]|nr:right-handed parallel beta-helix repeat-containing protein [Chitinophagales bacterium]
MKRFMQPTDNVRPGFGLRASGFGPLIVSPFKCLPFMLFVLLTCAPGSRLFGQDLGGDFAYQVDISQINPATGADMSGYPLFFVTITSTYPSPNSYVAHLGCMIHLRLRFELYDAAGALLETLHLPSEGEDFDLYRNTDWNMGAPFVLGYMNTFTAVSCVENVAYVQIYSQMHQNLYDTDFCNGTLDQGDFHSLTITYPDGATYVGSATGATPGGIIDESNIHTLNFPAPVDGTNIPLDLAILSDHQNCPAELLSYALPIGGCPPYTTTWFDSDGNVIPYPDFDETGFPYPEEGGNIIPVNVDNEYTVQVTDNNGNTASRSFKYGIDNYTISAGTNEVWDADDVLMDALFVDGEVVVETGATLTINDISVAFMGEYSGITVKKGGKLFVNNAVLYAQHCDVGADLADYPHWRGIAVEGNTSGVLNSTGEVVLHGATIRQASIGINAVLTNSIITTGTAPDMIKAYDSYFDNNRVAINVLSPMHLNCPIVIDNCTFAQSGFPEMGTYLNSSSHIVLAGVYKANIKNSRFYDNVNKGRTGITCIYAGAIIKNNDFGEPSKILYRGIDVLGSPAAQAAYMLIEDNRFVKTRKGINMLGSGFGRIRNNEFKIFHTAASAINGYGIFLENCMGVEVSGNILTATTQSLASPSTVVGTWGIVAKNIGCAGANISNNGFNAEGANSRFYAALQFEGNNENLELTCNIYGAPHMNDWMIAPSAVLGPQGECYPLEPSLSAPLREQWHVGGTGTYHIYNASSNMLEITPYNDAANIPTLISGNVEIDDPCNSTGTVNCAPLEMEPPSLVRDRLLAAQTEREYMAALRQLIQSRMANDEIAEVKLDLDEQTHDCARKIAVATRVTAAEFEAALARLAQLSLTEPDNQQFFELYTALIDAMTAGGSGKTDEAAEAFIADYALSEEPNTCYAEAYRAFYYGDSFDKTPAWVPTQKTSEAAAAAGGFIAGYSDGFVRLYFSTDLLAQLQNASCQIALIDLSGRRMSVHTADSPAQGYALPAADLPEGMYLLQLQNGQRTANTCKVTIIR